MPLNKETKPNRKACNDEEWLNKFGHGKFIIGQQPPPLKLSVISRSLKYVCIYLTLLPQATPLPHKVNF